MIASNLPDIDFVAGLFGASAYIEYHRGITHSLIGIAILSAVLSAITRHPKTVIVSPDFIVTPFFQPVRTSTPGP